MSREALLFVRICCYEPLLSSYVMDSRFVSQCELRQAERLRKRPVPRRATSARAGPVQVSGGVAHVSSCLVLSLCCSHCSNGLFSLVAFLFRAFWPSG